LIIIEQGKPFYVNNCDGCGEESILPFNGAGFYECQHCHKKFLIVQESVRLGKYYRRKPFSRIKELAKLLADQNLNEEKRFEKRSPKGIAR